MSDTSVSLPLLLAAGSNAALVTFLVYTVAVFGLAALSNRLLQSKSFLSEYFLGSRGLGVWAFALTFAATSASGGSFTGFPSKIYSHGWILGLWIGSYMVVPICAMGLLGKRINQVARLSGSITVPDVLRDRFNSPVFGLVSVSLIVFFMAFNLVAQFKSGSEILRTLLQDVAVFDAAVAVTGGIQANFSFLDGVDSAYFLCLLAFAIAVIVYTTYGGFHAVVWTDVMQGVVMVVGVLIMLPLAISQVGGLGKATTQIARMTPPRLGLGEVEVELPPAADFVITSPWLTLPSEDSELPRLFRLNGTLTVPAGQTKVRDIQFVELTTPEEIRQQLERLASDGEVAQLNAKVTELKKSQLEWRKEQNAKEPKDADSDSKDSEPADPVSERLESELAQLVDNRVAILNRESLNAVRFQVTLSRDYTYGAEKPGVYVTGPGPSPPRLPASAADAAATEPPKPSNGFLPLSLAVSFFFMWAISGAGQPSSMVRLMAFKNSTTLRRSIFTVAIYYSMIYFPLVVIFCCARVLLPGMDLESDRIMPQMAVTLTTNIGHGWLAGLLVAAPFAAVMSTVDSFLLMISSALVRDIYQRNMNPEASEKTIKTLSYVFTMIVGAGAMLGAVNPPQFLQDIIVYTGSGLAACFLAPMAAALYWPRSNKQGCIAAMLAGFAAHLAMYVGGVFAHGSFFKPYQLFNFDPIIVGLFVSFATVVVATLWTAPPPEELVRRYFCKRT